MVPQIENEEQRPVLRRRRVSFFLAVVSATVVVGICVTFAALWAGRPSTNDLETAQSTAYRAGAEAARIEWEDQSEKQIRAARIEAERSGYDKGYREGHRTGTEAGYEAGYADGEAAGYESGAAEGLQRGYSDGYADGAASEPEMTDEERLYMYGDLLKCMLEGSMPTYLCSRMF